MAEVARKNIEEIRPLTSAQEGILFHTLLAASSSLYVQQYTCLINGFLDADRFRTSWDKVIARHGALRSFFTWKGRERPLQVVRSHVQPEWHIADLKSDTPEGRQHLLDNYLKDDRDRGFDLESAPLTRFALFEMEKRSQRFVWTHHHLVLDGWSLGIVLNEVFAIYDALSLGRAHDLGTPAKHRQYQHWASEQDDAAMKRFWIDQINGIRQPTTLALESKGGSPWAESQAEAGIELGLESTLKLTGYAKTSSLTLSTLLRGAWAIVMSRYSSEEDIVFGATVAGRPAEMAGSTELVGLYLNTLPVRIRVDLAMTVSEWLTEIQAQRLDSSPYESASLADIQGWSDISPGKQLFDTVLAVENIPAAVETVAGLTIEKVRYLQQSNYTLALLAMPGATLRLRLLYDDARFNEAVALRILSHMQTVLLGLVDNSHVGDIQFFSGGELAELVEVSATRLEAEPTETVPEIIYRSTLEQSGEVAIAGPGYEVSYDSLGREAAGVTSRLQSAGIRPGNTVAVIAERSRWQIAAIIGILGAGCAYVPIDPRAPATRIALQLEDAAVVAAVIGPGLEAPYECPVIHLSDIDAATQIAPPEINPDDLAYLIFTSGSTGRAKAVEITHANLSYSTQARRAYYGEPVKSFLLVSPFYFDSSVVGLFWTLTTGGTLVLPEPNAELDVKGLAEMIRDHQVTHTLMLPSLYQELLEHTDPKFLKSLRLVIVAGEPCRKEVVDSHREALPGTELYNEYGPTEATVWSTVQRLHPTLKPTERVSIGRPIPGSRVVVLDRNLRRTPIGVTGEIFIGGPGLARGYRLQPGLTAEKFVEVDLDGVGRIVLYRTGDLARLDSNGEIYYLGRSDNQVKIRGQRIELGEIDQTLLEHSGVRSAATIVTGATNPRLVALVEPEIDTKELEELCKQRLPRAMVPDRIVSLMELPRGATGKVDRQALHNLDLETGIRDDVAKPLGDVEAVLASIWADVLGREEVGALDDFFELGGDSLLSIRIIARAHNAGIAVSVADFYDRPTVRAMASSAKIEA